MIDVDNLKIKKICLYNQKIYKQKNNKKKLKKVLSILISALIIAVLVFCYIKIVTIEKPAKFLAYIGIILFVLSIVFFFIFLYFLLSFFQFITDKEILSSRCYIITNDNRLISLKFLGDIFYSRYDIVKDSVLDDIIKYIFFRKKLKDENQKNFEKIEKNNINFENVIDCLDIVNVYKIKEFNDKIQVTCDYLNLLNNTSCKNQTITIYKYYDNWENILDLLKSKIKNGKQKIDNKDGEHRGFINFIVNCYKNKKNIIIYIIPFLVTIKDIMKISTEKKGDLIPIIIFYGLVVTIFSVIVYADKKALKYLTKDDKKEKEIILKQIKINILVLIVYSILALFFIMYSKYIIEAIIIFVIEFILGLIVIKKINK